MGMRAAKDIWPFREMAMDSCLKIRNPKIFKYARNAATAYQNTHDNFKFQFYETTEEHEGIKRPVLFIKRIPLKKKVWE